MYIEVYVIVHNEASTRFQTYQQKQFSIYDIFLNIKLQHVK